MQARNRVNWMAAAAAVALLLLATAAASSAAPPSSALAASASAPPQPSSPFAAPSRRPGAIRNAPLNASIAGGGGGGGPRARDLLHPSSSGYLTASKENGAELFYVYFEAEEPAGPLETTPILLWLQVRCCSMGGALVPLVVVVVVVVVDWFGADCWGCRVRDEAQTINQPNTTGKYASPRVAPAAAACLVSSTSTGRVRGFVTDGEGGCLAQQSCSRPLLGLDDEAGHASLPRGWRGGCDGPSTPFIPPPHPHPHPHPTPRPQSSCSPTCRWSPTPAAGTASTGSCTSTNPSGRGSASPALPPSRTRS